MNVGYAKVSTLDQNLKLQIQAFRKAGCKKLFCEKVSGVRRERPEFQRMVDQLRIGDTVIVWKLDRLARSTRDLFGDDGNYARGWHPLSVAVRTLGECHNSCRQADQDYFCGHRRV
jgi:hypothetical protein